MTKVLAVEWGPYGVRVAGIVPGIIAGTEGLARLGSIGNLNNKEKSNSSFSKSEDEDAMKKFATMIPVQKLGKPADIANAALYLASPAASYVTGTNLVVDGGQSLTSINFLFHDPSFVKMYAEAKM